LYFVTLAARVLVLPTGVGPCPLVDAGLLGPATAASSDHFPGTRCFTEELILLKNKFSNLLPICDRPSTLTSYSICDQQHILTAAKAHLLVLLHEYQEVCGEKGKMVGAWRERERERERE
jgi:hypothetical protein